MRNVYVDVDDVLAETSRALVAIAAERFGRVVRYEQMHTFDLRAVFDIDDDEHQALLDWTHRDETLESLIPLTDAADTLAKMKSRDIHVSIMTGRPPSTLPATRRWLDGCRIPYDALRAVDKYGRHEEDPDAMPKEHLRTQEFDLAVEDSLDMAVFLAEICSIEVVLLDRPWNRDAIPQAASRRITRVSQWSEVSELIAD